MSFFNKAKDAAKQGVDKVGADKVGDGIDRAGEFADEKTGGKHSDKIDKGVDAARDHVDRMDGGEDGNR
ncbi:hypothetical protein J2S40_004731 [Nocardioides luteus]|uniref:Antitoxin n=1 Tax=Nocardioides luteus TaxID=1844 RepID=A0ABQ5T210_9ACTN|nr:antitoxin [Nocardioides luteus]MDR7313673.1 hypothetical protein [Nocardioides luteus]GGR64111.1 hypothetical protein GCM10010197_34460 [Nocardioides luteus]GLJ70480.1 hypothetical protein GCM10017579_45160 [Nocardioides luteus]